MKQVLGGMLLAAAFAVFGYTLYNTAWISDDAYISFRTVDNVVHGYGLTWNVSERVQAFTNPLWVLLNAVPYAFLKEPWHIYFSALSVSVVVSLLALCLLSAGVARDWAAAFFGVTALTFSRAFVDYSTSGLENPMTHLLLALFMIYFLRTRWTMGVLFSMSLVASLSLVNRLDTALLYAPVLAYAWLGERNLKATVVMLAGFAPFIAWEVFSVVYYGFPFPNTAYAKLGTGIEAHEVVVQGLWYLHNSITLDPLTLTVIAAGLLGTPFLFRDGRYTAVALGGVLYMAYVVKVGGDFMQGRFLAAPFFLAILLLVRLKGFARPMVAMAATVLVVALSMQAPNAPLFTGQNYRNNTDFKDAHGIGDERKFYMSVSGLSLWDGHKPLPTHAYAETGRQAQAAGKYLAPTHGAVGFRGFFYGPKAYIIDYYGLADPLLARIPARFNPAWRIGHFTREVPAWYSALHQAQASRLQSDHPNGPAVGLAEVAAIFPPGQVDLTGDTDATPRANNDADLKRYYAQLDLITRGPLWSPDRWRAIVDMNLGRNGALVHRDLYRFPKIAVRTLESLSTPKDAGTVWNAPGNLMLNGNVADITLGQVAHNSVLEFSGDHNDSFRLLYLLAGKEVASSDIPVERQKNGGLRVIKVTLPNAAIRNGYDTVRIVPYGGDAKSSVGHLRLL